MSDALKITLQVDDKGSVVVKKFSSGAEKKIKTMASRSTNYLKKMATAFKKVGGAAAAVGKKIAGITAKAAALGIALAAAVVGFTLKGAIQKFASFESALVDMGKVTSESLDSIKKKIMDLDPALGSSTELVKGYYQVISAGVTDPVKAMETLKVATMAAKAAHVDQSEVIKGLTKVMAGYEGKIKTVSEAADLLYAIEKEGQTSVAELIPVIGGLAKMSHDLGVSQNELGAALATVSQTAGSTSEAATQYQSVLTALMKPTTAMKEAIHEMGYESAQAAIADIGLTETLKLLKEQTGGSAEKMAQLFGRVEAMKGMSALAVGDFETLTGKVEAMKNKTGAAAAAWDKYKKTLTAIWETFKSTVGKQLIMIGDKLAPHIKKVVEGLGEWLEHNREMLTQEIGDWLKGVVDFAGQLWPLVRDIATKFGEWYTKNEAMLKLKFNEYLDKVKTAIEQLKENIDIILIPFKKFYETMENLAGKLALIASDIATLHDKLENIKKIFEEQGWKKAVEELLKPLGNLNEKLNTFKERLLELSNPLILITKFFRESGKLVDFFVTKVKAAITTLKGFVKFIEYLRNPVKFAVDFVGKGSTELPLTEKIQELEGKIKGFVQSVEEQKPKLILDVTPAMEAIETLRRSMQKNLSIMIEEWAITIAALEQAGESARAREMRMRAREDIAYSKGVHEKAIIEAEALGGGSDVDIFPHKNYQFGTGPQGLPYTGLFLGHKGEIVKTPTESKRERTEKKGLKLRDINIMIPESAAPQSPEDWRYITREFIKPELEKIGSVH